MAFPFSNADGQHPPAKKQKKLDAVAKCDDTEESENRTYCPQYSADETILPDKSCVRVTQSSATGA